MENISGKSKEVLKGMFGDRIELSSHQKLYCKAYVLYTLQLSLYRLLTAAHRQAQKGHCIASVTVQIYSWPLVPTC